MHVLADFVPSLRNAVIVAVYGKQFLEQPLNMVRGDCKSAIRQAVKYRRPSTFFNQVGFFLPNLRRFCFCRDIRGVNG